MEELSQPMPLHLRFYKSSTENVWKKNCTSASLSCHLHHVKQIPSFSAVVLDLLSTFLQRLQEKVRVSVGLDQHQFLRQVDLKLHVWEQREQRGHFVWFQETTMRHPAPRLTRQQKIHPAVILMFIMLHFCLQFSNKVNLFSNFPSRVDEREQCEGIWRQVFTLRAKCKFPVVTSLPRQWDWYEPETQPSHWRNSRFYWASQIKVYQEVHQVTSGLTQRSEPRSHGDGCNARCLLKALILHFYWTPRKFRGDSWVLWGSKWYMLVLHVLLMGGL